jgi:integrase
MRRTDKGPRIKLRDPRRPGESYRWVILDRDGAGRRLERKTGTSAPDRATAQGLRSEAEQVFAEYLGKKHQPQFGNGDPNQVRIADLLAFYGEQKAPLAVRSDTIAAAIENLGEFWSDDVVSAITPKRCGDYVKWRCSESMARNDLLTLQAALNFAHANRKLMHKIAVTKPNPPQKRVRWLTRSEAARLLAGALGWDTDGKRHRDKINYRLARFIITGYRTGTRSDRILRLQWVTNLDGGWIDLDRGMLHRRGAREEETKKRAPTVPLGDRLYAHMRRWRKLTARFLIEHHGKPIGDLSDAWETATALAGLDHPVGHPERVTPHVLRHTCCSWLLQAGLSEWKVGKFVGMSPALVASTYGHVSEDVQRETANAIGRHPGRGAKYLAPRTAVPLVSSSKSQRPRGSRRPGSRRRVAYE